MTELQQVVEQFLEVKLKDYKTISLVIFYPREVNVKVERNEDLVEVEREEFVEANTKRRVDAKAERKREVHEVEREKSAEANTKRVREVKEEVNKWLNCLKMNLIS